MNEKSEKRKIGAEDAEEVKEILGVVSTEIPALIRSLICAVFSEEAGKNMGRAAAAFYKELKDSGMPDDVAVKMTEDYIGVFTSLGDVLKGVGEEGKSFLPIEKGKGSTSYESGPFVIFAHPKKKKASERHRQTED